MSSRQSRRRRVPAWLTAALLVLVVGSTSAFAAVEHREHALHHPGAASAAQGAAAAVPSATASAAATASAGSTGSATPGASDAPSSAESSADATVVESAPVVVSGPYRVVGLGDSVPAGTACGCTTYVDLVAQQLAAQQGVDASVDNLAVAGQTTSEVLDQLQDSDTRSAVADADLVVVTIGANDFDADEVTDDDCANAACYASDLSTQAAQLGQLLAEVGSLQAGHGKVVVTGYWNVFLDGDVGRQLGSDYVANSDALTRASNTVIQQAATAAGDVYVDLYTPFKGDGSSDDTRLLASDGDHPDAAGHRVIASAVLAAL